ncbi:MAG: phenylalanine--tRNA ligase subunit beta, partial [Deltaproteobacteria bacterium]|nr:phenylalanine--tRNA ligase subunit beta [Deltaproteobacteria bacterium]
NNVVDATNYILLELGQPLHAFDLNKLRGARIDARLAGEGEKITTIDGKERALDSSMLVIADAEGPVALAGVMGGKESEVSGSTTDVLLESAWFEPSSVRRTSRKAALSSDSSYRFERGVDMEGVVAALDAAASMIKRLAGGEIAQGIIDIYPEELPMSPIKLRLGRTSDVLGVRLTKKDAVDTLVRLGMAVEEAGEGALTVTPPSYRVDIKEEADLVEEAARVFGYDRIPTTLPVARLTPGEPGPRTRLRRKAAGVLTNEGFFEAINYSFVSRDMFSLTGPEGKAGVTILNPLTEEQVVMRDSLIPSLLDTLRRNILRKNEDLRIFEFAPAFVPSAGAKLPSERWKLSGLMYGRRWGVSGRSWSYPKEQCDFFDMKGVVEKLFDALGAEGALKAGPVEGEYLKLFHPGKCASVTAGALPAGVFGEIHPDIAARFDLKRPAYVFELDAEALAGLFGRKRPYTQLPRFPESTRDIAFIVDENVPYAEIINSIELLNTKLIERVELFDVYCGGNIPGGMKSMALRIVYRSKAATLTHEEVEEAHSAVAEKLREKFNAEVRGGETRNM